ncbi:phosphatase PAP2/dual specificity phosphatase family protein [Symmachiella macrocystis]|nr:phosphatase PAP2/dual specificity phosphatase family protein [Symmachiella macrocystis]
MSWKQPALTSAGLSLLFMLVYSATNYISSLRSDVGTWYYDWEQIIPFVPAMIIPYMSIDLFFVAAPFLCRDRVELRILSRRILLAILLAGGCFLLFPLQLAVERPPVSGMLGELFNQFRQFDLPYNLCPSLHIALRTILAVHYARHTHGAVRWASNFWFSLIGLSTLLTYQHHIVDVAGGFVLAAVCFYLVRSTPFRLPVEQNMAVGRRYACGAIALAVVGIGIGSWGLWLLWPAVSAGLVAAGYFGIGPGIFDKRDGQLPFCSQLILAPVFFGQYLSWLHYRQECRPWDTVTEQLRIGRRLADHEAAEAIRAGVTAVVDLTVAFSEPSEFQRLDYLALPVLDLTAPTPEQLDTAVQFIELHSQRGVVYVHCNIGYSRSAAVVGAYLLHTGMARHADEAMAQLRAARPTIVIRPEAEAAIRRYHRERCGR